MIVFAPWLQMWWICSQTQRPEGQGHIRGLRVCDRVHLKIEVSWRIIVGTEAFGAWRLPLGTVNVQLKKKLEPKQTQTLGTQLLGPNTPWYYDFLFSCGGEGIGGDWWSGDPLALVHWVSSCWKEIEDEEYVAGRLWLVTVWLTRQGSTVYSAVFVWLKFPCCAEVWCLLKSLWNEWKSSPSETHWH